MLINVRGNALQHNGKDTRVAVRLSRVKDKALISLKDNGKGVSPEHLPHLFQRFYKAESSRSSKGFGIGLMIARFIVQAHGGTIQAFSLPGEGTEIQIQLPLIRK